MLSAQSLEEKQSNVRLYTLTYEAPLDWGDQVEVTMEKFSAQRSHNFSTI